jgi:PST family polysaccharide transporter
MQYKQSLKLNILSMATLQGFSFIVTFVTLPYLARVFDVDGWGSLVFIQLIIGYLVWVSNWGFYLGVAKTVSVCRDNLENLSRIFIITWVAQCILTIVIYTIFFIALSFIDISYSHKILYLIASGLLFGNFLTPLWLLNGLEKIKEAAAIQIGSKLVALPFVFAFVRTKSDAGIYLAINSISSIFFGLVTILWVHKNIKIRWHYPSLIEVYNTFTDDYQIFKSTFWANVSSSLIPMLLGFFSGPTELGYFSLADRAKSAAVIIFHPISHALFPRMCHLYTHNRNSAIEMLRKSGAIILPSSFILSVAIFTYPGEILAVLGGENYLPARSVLLWLAFAPFFLTSSSFLIHQVLIPAGEKRLYGKVMFFSFIICVVLAMPLIYLLGSNGAAITALVTEFFTAMFLFYKCYSLRLLVKHE